MLAVEGILDIIFIDKKIRGLNSGHLTPGPVAFSLLPLCWKIKMQVGAGRKEAEKTECKCFKMVKN